MEPKKSAIYQIKEENLKFHKVFSISFQQDVATPHTARETIAILRDAFSVKLISCSSDVSWPPRLLDLTPPDFSLWGYPK